MNENRTNSMVEKARKKMFDFVPKNSPWARKPSDLPWNSVKPTVAKRRSWIPARLTGKFKFRRQNTVNDLNTRLEEELEINAEKYPNCNNQVKFYCESTSLHGFKYITEAKRNPCERIMWLCWCLFGIVAAAYMMTKIWTRWEENPVLTSVSSTNYPISGIIFPAVTICTVNKAVTEKLIIQACRYNLTLSQMKFVISNLVDPEARNNDNVLQGNPIIIDGKSALRFLRLVAPKCDDYLITCRWNSIGIRCNEIFTLTLTDTGYCCTFNYIDKNYDRKDKDSDEEVKMQEIEFEYLQQAVWTYTDRFREKNGVPDTETASNSTPSVDSFTCSRIYDDDLFPGICKYINTCRNNPLTCNLSPSDPTPEPKKKFSDDFPLKASGAGRSRGLTIMTDTLRCDSVPTGSFKGLRVYIHHPEEFPNVGERGFVIAPGQENNIGVSATDIYSTPVLRTFHPFRRGCFFTEEFPLQYYKEYSRSSCVIECENEFIYRECECVPFYSPGNYSICGVNKFLGCVKKAIDVIQKRTLLKKSSNDGKKLFKFKSREEMQQDKSCTEFCLPSCAETFYTVVVTNAPFPNQPEPNQTKLIRESISDKRPFLSDISYISGSISVMRIFFRETSIMRYKRDELFTWEDFVSNLGGIMGLCMGFSLLSVLELIYFFTIRFFIDKKRFRESTSAVNRIVSGKF